MTMNQRAEAWRFVARASGLCRTVTGWKTALRPAAAVAILAAICMATAAAVAQNAPPGRQPPRRTDPRVFPAKPAIEADLATLDDELAQYIQFRGDVQPDAAARLELLIDLRVTARWLLTAALAEKPESDLQIAAMLRADELRQTAATLAELFKTMPRPSAPQLDGMTRIHALTYKLPELGQIRQADEVCREIGSLLVTAAGPLPPEVRQIPLMRPQAVSRGEPVAPRATQPAAIAEDPVARANQLAVSPPLKRQVLNLLTLAISAQNDARTDPKRSPEASAMMASAQRALDLAEALARGTAVDASSRAHLEQRLADGLALYSDPRTRASGQSRLSSLDDYARTIGRIRRMNLRPELQQKLTPAFAWAGDNPEHSGKLMATIEAYLEVSARLDARAADPQQQLPPREAKAVADSIKAATTEREAFLNDAAGMGKPGQLVDPASLAGRLDAMKQAISSAETYEAVPRSLQTLLAFKPRPTGGLERRFAGLMTTLNDPRPSGLKDEAARTLADMVRVAELATDEPTAPLPQDVQTLYARGRLAAFEARRRDLVADLASELASGKKSIDAGKIQRLREMRELRAVLTEAATFELVLRRSEALSRWVDWRIDPAELTALITPYRDAIGSLFDAYSNPADPTPPMSLKPLRDRYGPIMALVVRQLPYGDSCSVLPTGLAGHIGRLMTPMESQPFANERYATYAVKLWKRYADAQNPESAEAVAATLAARAGK